MSLNDPIGWSGPRPMPPHRIRWFTVRPRFLVGVLAVSFLLGGAGWLWLRRHHPPMGSGPAGPSLPAAVFAGSWWSGDTLLVGIGDSIVTGFGAPAGFGFFDRLTANPSEDEPDMAGKNLRIVLPGLRVLNLACESTSSGYHLRTEVQRLPLQPASVRGIVVLSSGGIDLIHDYGEGPPRDEAIYGASWKDGKVFAARFRSRLEQMLDEINRRFPGGCDIFIATIFDPTDGIGDIENTDPILRLFKPLPPWPDGLRIHAAFNDHIRTAAAARSNVHVVDVYQALLGHGMHCRDRSNPAFHPADPTYWYYYNLEDPNRRGYDAIRRAFLTEMVRVLAPRNGL